MAFVKVVVYIGFLLETKHVWLSQIVENVLVSPTFL